jgi:3-hydroxy-9,10-secoandrosta-1,3,5(10)-triene-9,17-dione monooxygenase reductase component
MSLDKKQFRATLGRFATGVVAVTSLAEDKSPVGMTVNSFTSVSLDPPLVLFCSYPFGATATAIQSSGAYAVNILTLEQMDICQRLAGMKDEERFQGLDWEGAPTSGSPWLKDCLAWLDCRLFQTYEAGDHIILVGQVCDIRLGQERDPLLFFDGGWPKIQKG